MKKLYLIPALILIFAMLFISCQFSEKEKENKETADGYIEDELPEMNFDGKTFRFISCGDGTGGTWGARDLIRESETGDAINDAIYLRNKRIQERFNALIKISFNIDLEHVNNSVNSGENSFEAVWLGSEDMAKGAQNHYFMDLKELPYMNLNKKYWDQSLLHDLSIGGKNYFVTGDISTIDKVITWIMMFNKSMLRDYDLESIYSLVKNGEWTIAKFMEMLRSTSSDLNGDGVWDGDDQYGLATTNDTVYGLYYGCGETVVNKNKSDIMEFKYKNGSGLEKFQNVADFTVEIMRKNHSTAIPDDISISGGMAAIFRGNRSLFFGEVLDYVFHFRNDEMDFGIIPMPKYDKEQEHYISFVHPAVVLLGVPSNCNEKEFTGVILEAMAAESRRTVKPAFYDVTLKTKSARDNESSEMLDIIFENRAYDLGLIYNLGDFITSYVPMIMNGDSNVTSLIEKYGDTAVQQIDKFNSEFK